ncbi:MAG: ribonuclease H-like domain-containing protein [Candidatus Krumholzibacteriia bacterium]
MDLRARLARLDGLNRKPEPPRRPDVQEPGAVLARLGLVETPGPGGPVWMSASEVGLDPPPGGVPDLGGFLGRACAEGIAPGDVLFLDTETTGLAGGAGTIPFLVGVAWWDGDRFEIRQYFLPDPGREDAMLAALADLARRFRAVATYNGAAFDLPLLRSRSVVNRSRDPLAGLESWDLLVPARRLWSRSLTDCRQQTIEAHLRGAPRGEGDIDGSLIPQTWFAFLRGEDAGDLERVLRHNRRDMEGMGIVFRAVCRWAGVIDEPGRHAQVGWRLAWSLARLAAARGNLDAGCVWLASALDDLAGQGQDPAVDPAPAGFWRDGLVLAKRARRHHLSRRILQAALAADPRSPRLHREAAILFEHRLPQLDRALEHAFQSEEPRRVRRLQRKLGRAGRACPPGSEEGSNEHADQG